MPTPNSPNLVNLVKCPSNLQHCKPDPATLNVKHMNEKKAKTQKVQRTDRTFKFDLDTRNYSFFEGITFTSQGQVQGLKWGRGWPLIGDNHLEYGYERDSGKKKILAQGKMPANYCFVNPSLPLFEFDHILAVDTNTKLVGKDMVSVGSVVYSKIGQRTGNHATMTDPVVTAWYEYRNVKGPPENLVWKEIAEAFCLLPELKGERVGLVVDSDLGRHKMYNKRELPIYDKFYLPENFTLIYGSTDGGKEVLANKLISFSDKRSNYLLSLLSKEDSFNENLGTVEGRPYTHFRQWNADQKCSENILSLEDLNR